jgi:hypothetical protein
MPQRKVVIKQCRFSIYGCTYRPHAGHPHEERCSYRPMWIECDSAWRELVNRTARQHTIDVVGALGAWARELQPVSFLSPNQSPIQDIPYSLDVSSWWTKGTPDADAVQVDLGAALRRSLGAGDAQYLLNQMRPSSTHTPQQVVRYLNLKSPRRMLQKFGFEAPSWIRLETDACLWNVTPRYSFTDLHTDRGLDTIAFQVGGRKIWLLYEPDPPITVGNKVLERQSSYYTAWANRVQGATSGDTTDKLSLSLLEQLGPSMRRPYIAITEGQQGLYIPAGWKHAVFTVESGYLGGYSFCTHDHIRQHVNTLLCEIHAAQQLVDTRQYTTSTDHFHPELWAELDGSLPYVLEHLHEELSLAVAERATEAQVLWRSLQCLLQRVTPALLRKHIRIINKCKNMCL